MEQNDKRKYNRSHGSGHVFSGLILLAAGALLLASRAGAPVPDWLFSWHSLLIAIGLFIGFRSNFRNPGWVIMFSIGGFFLLDDVMPGYKFHDFILPAILITVGAFFLTRPKAGWKRNRRWNRWERNEEDPGLPSTITTPSGFEGTPEEGEYIDVNAVFGGVKKLILSKNFKGGEMNCFMGGTEINLLQADIQGPVELEINAVFGGAKLVVPSNWDVKNEISAVFGGVEDKRSINSATPDPNKSIILRGTVVFGGIEIKNF
jgi:predicted membrane protein